MDIFDPANPESFKTDTEMSCTGAPASTTAPAHAERVVAIGCLAARLAATGLVDRVVAETRRITAPA